MRKVALRLLPFLLLLYICNLVDRGNVGFTKKKMQADLGMTAAVYGSAVGMFYLGYLLFEVPSNMILRRTGARVWIARIMVTWGFVSGAEMLVTGFWSFSLLRVLLGIAEAGFFPGIIYYLTYWFPTRERTRAVASFMAANALGGMISNSLSGVIMKNFDLVGGLHGWQWVFLLESIPSVVLGVVVLFYLTDRPSQAHWLADDERAWLCDRMHQEEKHREQRHGADFRQAMTDTRVWFLILLYATVAYSSNAGSLYVPELIDNCFPDADETERGLISSVPSLCALVGMLINAAWSDRTRRHRLHVAGAAFVGSLGWILAASANSPIFRFIGICLAMAGMLSMLPPFWSLPTSFLSGAAAAGGIALINSVANIGGAVGPGTIGKIHDFDRTGSYAVALSTLAGVMFVGAILALFAPHDATLGAEES
jgi:ACS family tartrate transporter-like MFS transporter